MCHVCQGSYLRFAGLFVLFSTLYMLLAADADQRKIKSAAIRCHCRGQASPSMSPERLHLKVSKDLKGIGPAIASLCTAHTHALISSHIHDHLQRDGWRKKIRIGRHKIDWSIVTQSHIYDHLCVHISLHIFLCGAASGVALNPEFGEISFDQYIAHLCKIHTYIHI